MDMNFGEYSSTSTSIKANFLQFHTAFLECDERFLGR